MCTSNGIFMSKSFMMKIIFQEFPFFFFFLQTTFQKMAPRSQGFGMSDTQTVQTYCDSCAFPYKKIKRGKKKIT